MASTLNLCHSKRVVNKGEYCESILKTEGKVFKVTTSRRSMGKG